MSDVETISAGLASLTTSVSTLVGMRVLGADGESCGTVHEFAVDVSKDGSRVVGLVLQQKRDGKVHTTIVPVEDIALPKAADTVLRARNTPGHLAHMGHYLLLERDLLDQQIIDVDGRKVVRVNDVNLAWESGEADASVALRIQEVEVGLRGASRRLLKGLPVGAVDSISNRFSARVIPWECVDLIERDPARRVRLKIGQERLAKLHPSDIAQILEELAPAEREAVFSALPEETAAETLEEFEPKLQIELVQRMDSERAADIIEEMDPGAAADLLNELSDEESEAILDEMEPEERQEMEELLEFGASTAGGLMTTDFVGVPKDATVAGAIDAIREFEGDTETITEIYLLGEGDKLAGVVALARLLLSPGETRLDLSLRAIT